jgi:hypothetical protein
MTCKHYPPTRRQVTNTFILGFKLQKSIPKKYSSPPPVPRKGHPATCSTDPYYGLVTILSLEIKHIVCAITQPRTLLGTSRFCSSSLPSYISFKIPFWPAKSGQCPWPGTVVQYDFLWLWVYAYDSRQVFRFSLNCDLGTRFLLLWIL